MAKTTRNNVFLSRTNREKALTRGDTYWQMSSLPQDPWPEHMFGHCKGGGGTKLLVTAFTIQSLVFIRNKTKQNRAGVAAVVVTVRVMVSTYGGIGAGGDGEEDERGGLHGLGWVPLIETVKARTDALRGSWS